MSWLLKLGLNPLYPLFTLWRCNPALLSPATTHCQPLADFAPYRNVKMKIGNYSDPPISEVAKRFSDLQAETDIEDESIKRILAKEKTFIHTDTSSGGNKSERYVSHDPFLMSFYMYRFQRNTTSLVLFFCWLYVSTQYMSQMLYAGCTGHSSCASAVKFYNMRVNLSVTHLAKFHGPWPVLWPDLWLLKIGHKFYHEFFMQVVPVIWQLLLILITKVGVAMKNLGNFLHYRHKNFENQFRNSWDN